MKVLHCWGCGVGELGFTNMGDFGHYCPNEKNWKYDGLPTLLASLTIVFEEANDVVGLVISFSIIGNVIDCLEHLMFDAQQEPLYSQTNGHNNGCPFNYWVSNLVYDNSFRVFPCFSSYKLLDEGGVLRSHRDRIVGCW